MKTTLRTLLGVVTGMARGFRAGDRRRILQCGGPSCPAGIQRYDGRNVSTCRSISELGFGGCRPGVECNSVRKHLGRHTNRKSMGGDRGHPLLDVGDRIQRHEAPVRDVVQGRDADLFPGGVLPGSQTQFRECWKKTGRRRRIDGHSRERLLRRSRRPRPTSL